MFSTSFGLRAARGVPQPAPPVITRSNPHADAVQFASYYRQKYPVESKWIEGPVNVKVFFDDFDIHVQGAEFLNNVLKELAAENQAAKEKVKNLALQWSQLNTAKYEKVTEDSTLAVFSDYEHANYDESLLLDILAEIKVMKKGKPTEELKAPSTVPGE